MEQGNYQIAVEYYNIALEVAPDDANALHGRAYAKKQGGEHEGVVGDFVHALLAED